MFPPLLKRLLAECGVDPNDIERMDDEMATMGAAIKVNMQDDGESTLSPAVQRYLDQVEEVLVELRVNDTIAALLALPDRIGQAQTMVNNARTRTETFKRVDLANAKEHLDMATLAVSMAATLDGKNAETRALQLKAALAQDKQVRMWLEAVDRAETSLLGLERDVAEAETEMARLRDWFKAQLAVAGLLQAVVSSTKVSI